MFCSCLRSLRGTLKKCSASSLNSGLSCLTQIPTSGIPITQKSHSFPLSSPTLRRAIKLKSRKRKNTRCGGWHDCGRADFKSEPEFKNSNSKVQHNIKDITVPTATPLGKAKTDLSQFREREDPEFTQIFFQTRLYLLWVHTHIYWKFLIKSSASIQNSTCKE